MRTEGNQTTMKRILFTIAAIVALSSVAYAGDSANFWGEHDAAKAYWDHHDKELKGQCDNYEYLMRLASFYEKSRDISPGQHVEYAAAFVDKLRGMLKSDSSN
jgi:hypothetical protein